MAAARQQEAQASHMLDDARAALDALIMSPGDSQ
jgi:hypothetical protein